MNPHSQSLAEQPPLPHNHARYDRVGNRLSSTGVALYNYNSSNELTSNSNASFTYDYNGNTLTKTDSSGTTTYAWDFENKLTSVTLPGSGGTISFKYDPFGRRIYKSSTSGTEAFSYDRENLVEEMNNSGAVVARYSHGLNIDEPLAVSRSGMTSYYHSDGLGSINSLSGGGGSLVQSYTSDSFGKQTASSGSLINPFQYTARESDIEANLYYYRARYYDPQIGRLLSEDPLGFRTGPNFYVYALNDPVLLADPLGLESKPNFNAPKKAACPGCVEKAMQQLQKELADIQRKLGKPGCVVQCSILGFADDAAAVGLSLFSKTIRTWLAGETGKLVMKSAGWCGLAAAAIYCSIKCDVSLPSPCPESGRCVLDSPAGRFVSGLSFHP